ncbi:MAG TPA: redox-regulated ATPase YchF [archaeon]|nr:redox-regulated ATPase YchF [archaeon]
MLIGIVGKPSVGKSSFFKAATMVDVKIAAYPFTTIDPNKAVGYVRVQCADKDLGVQCNPRVGFCKNHIRFVPVELMDVAGLVPGAHEGKGLGNKFLNDLGQADVLIHIVDVSGSTNEVGESVPPLSYDPANDIRFLETELDMWYFDVIKRGWEKMARKAQTSKIHIETAVADHLSGFRVTETMARKAIEELKLDKERPTTWSEEQLKELALRFRKETKPTIIVCNKIDVPGAEKNFARLKEEFKEHMLVPCSADAEIALREASKKGLVDYVPGEGKFTIKSGVNEKQKAALEFIQKNLLEKFGSTGIQNSLDAAVFDFLKYIAIFPGGVSKLGDKEGRIMPDCFLMPPGTTALDFANKIHTDLGKGFLYAIDVRTKMRISGDQKLKHRDVIEIISAAK